LVLADSGIPESKWQSPCMAKLDRLEWTGGFSFTLHGARVGVRANQPEALATLVEHLPQGWKPANHKVVEQLYSLKVGGPGIRPNIRQFHLLYGNSRKLARTMNLEEVFAAFQKDLRHSVALLAKQKVFICAGVVGWRGRAILVVGKKQSGKTRLVEALLKAGASYYSDEYAMLDARGRVHPYGALEDGLQGAETGTKTLPVGTILITGYRADSAFRPRRLSPGQAALELMSHSVATSRMPQTTLAFARKAVARAQAFKGVRGEANELVAYLLENSTG
jgi:hypothetical protein